MWEILCPTLYKCENRNKDSRNRKRESPVSAVGICCTCAVILTSHNRARYMNIPDPYSDRGEIYGREK